MLKGIFEMFYRVTHLLVQNLPLTSKVKFRFGLACPGLARPNRNFTFEVNVRFCTRRWVTLYIRYQQGDQQHDFGIKYDHRFDLSPPPTPSTSKPSRRASCFDDGYRSLPRRYIVLKQFDTIQDAP